MRLQLFTLLTASLMFFSGCGENAKEDKSKEVKTSAIPEKTYTLTLATTWAEQVPFLGPAPLTLAQTVDKMSNGRLKIKVDSPNKHKAPFGVMDMVKEGQYDLAYTASYYYKGKDYKLVFFTTVPFGMLLSEQYAWYNYGGGKELAAKVYGEHGLISYPMGSTGMQMGGWFKKEIKSLDDLKGLKFRIPGQGGEVMAKLGVNAVNTPPGELYTSLERNTIDAVEWISPVFDFAMGFHKLANYYYTGWQEPASEIQLLANKKKIDALPADLRAILESAIKSVGSQLMDQATHANAEAWANIAKEYPNVKVQQFPADVMAALKKAAREIEDEQAAKDPIFKEILESQRAYLAKVRPWTLMGEYGYLKQLEQ